MKFIYNEPPTVGKFVAFYGDGSGAAVFYKNKNGTIINADGDKITNEFLLDQGFCECMPLPDSFKLWYEFSE